MMEIKPERLYRNMDEYIRFYKENDNMYWYNYRDLISALYITSRKADEIYKEWLNEDEKTWFNEINLNGRYDPTKYVSSNGMYRILDRNNQRVNEIVKLIISNETRNDDEYIDFKNDINNLTNQMDKADVNIDFVNVAMTVKKIYESESCRDILDKAGIIDKEKEYIIDEFRYDLYDVDCDEVEWTVVKREDDFKTVNYRRNKTSTCPTWLKNVVK